MKRPTILAIITIAAVVAYPLIFWRLFGLCTVNLLTPGLLHAAKSIGGHATLIGLHAAINLLLSLVLAMPIAILIAIAFRKAWPAVAVLLGLLLMSPDILGFSDAWREITNHAALLRGLAADSMTVFAATFGMTYAMSLLAHTFVGAKIEQ